MPRQGGSDLPAKGDQGAYFVTIHHEIRCPALSRARAQPSPACKAKLSPSAWLGACRWAVPRRAPVRDRSCGRSQRGHVCSILLSPMSNIFHSSDTSVPRGAGLARACPAWEESWGWRCWCWAPTSPCPAGSTRPQHGAHIHICTNAALVCERLRSHAEQKGLF